MNLITIIGLLAGTFTTMAFIPQMVKTWKTKSAKDLSLIMLITLNVGTLLWLIYGIAINSLPVILANGFTLIFHIINLSLKIKYGKNFSKKHL
ncbi:SemiSWEET family sugar transporter [Calothrix sp. 336/3]|uniref:SemiSWEET family sugar transporter n=1 Tax=Calothrix sp. 336/3 TaxID=1337936 RepID=UPI0004E4101D|nr:SemiSWEET transporter [Calothrix sp. 336/3]AKG21072.1 MtN3 and saliva related transmembrane protein [Calothrix sp. 336/3]